MHTRNYYTKTECNNFQAFVINGCIHFHLYKIMQISVYCVQWIKYGHFGGLPEGNG